MQEERSNTTDKRTRSGLSRAERERMLKKKKTRRMKKYIRFFAAWGIVLVLIIVIIVLIVSCSKKNKKTSPDNAGTAETQTETVSSETGEQAETFTETQTQPGPQVEGSTDGHGNVTSIKVNYPKISMDGLSDEFVYWGGAGSPDENGQPIWSVQYQDLYGESLNSYFIGPWEPGDPKVIYLTMDEGYENGYTPAILDTLKEKNVKCVFFCTLPFVTEEPELVKRMIDEGHQVANHSVNHPSDGLPSESYEEQENEVMEVDRYVREHYDYQMHLFRFPAGIFSEKSLAIVNNCNYKSVFWSFMHIDYDVNNQPDVKESLDYAVSCLHPGAIYLLHAVSSTNTAMLGDFIDQARAQGYEFELLQ